MTLLCQCSRLSSNTNLNYWCFMKYILLSSSIERMAHLNKLHRAALFMKSLDENVSHCRSNVIFSNIHGCGWVALSLWWAMLFSILILVLLWGICYCDGKSLSNKCFFPVVTGFACFSWLLSSIIVCHLNNAIRNK